LPLIKNVNFSPKKNENSKLKIIGSNKLFLFSNSKEKNNLKLAESIVKLNSIKGISSEKAQNICLFNKNHSDERCKVFSPPMHPLSVVTNNFKIENEKGFNNFNFNNNNNNNNFSSGSACERNLNLNTIRSNRVLKNELISTQKIDCFNKVNNVNNVNNINNNCDIARKNYYSSQLTSKERSLNDHESINIKKNKEYLGNSK